MGIDCLRRDVGAFHSLRMGAATSYDPDSGPDVDLGDTSAEDLKFLEDHKGAFYTLRLLLERASFPGNKNMDFGVVDWIMCGSGADSHLVVQWGSYERPDGPVNRASDRQEGAPIAADDRYFPDWAFNVNIIRFDDRVRAGGLGRLFTNAVLQSLTRNANVPQIVSINTCHFPIFFTIDSYYGWFRSKYVPQGTRAGLIFPRYWPTRSQAQVEANEEAIYKYTDLVWTTPLLIAEARNKAYFSYSEQVIAEANRCVRELNWALRFVDPSGPQKVQGDLRPGDWKFAIATAPLRLTLPGRSALADAVAAHCVGLGYNNLPGDDRVAAIVLAVNSFPKWDMAMIFAILRFLIDQERVLFRPIVLTDGLVRWLLRTADDRRVKHINDLILVTNTWDEWHAPYFVHIDKSWLWVPTKKPHSSTYDGKEYIPPPRQESPPFFVEELTVERPTKRRRTDKLDCLHCGTTHEAVAEKMAFCTPHCSRMYYA